MNDITKDMREKTLLLSMVAELVLKKRNLCGLLCIIRAGKLAVWYIEMWTYPRWQQQMALVPVVKNTAIPNLSRLDNKNAG